MWKGKSMKEAVKDGFAIIKQFLLFLPPIGRLSASWRIDIDLQNIGSVGRPDSYREAGIGLQNRVSPLLRLRRARTAVRPE
jgi:hypothetical protein